jgi:hypothetical protein
MGFRDWFEAFKLIVVFGILIGVPCFFTAILGSRMINDLGNFPTKSAQIQKKASWIVIIIQVISFIFLLGFFNAIS